MGLAFDSYASKVVYSTVFHSEYRVDVPVWSTSCVATIERVEPGTGTAWIQAAPARNARAEEAVDLMPNTSMIVM